MFTVRSMQEEDLGIVAQLNRECFPGDNSTLADARKWIEASWKAVPRISCFVLVDEKGQVGGYILWLEKGGFRKEAVLELEQIGVADSLRGRGRGKLLICESLSALKARLLGERRSLHLVEVTTGVGNEAQRLYRDTLGAEIEATIRGLFGEKDEVVMIARDP